MRRPRMLASLLALLATLAPRASAAAQSNDRAPAGPTDRIPASRLDSVTAFVARNHARLGLPAVAIAVATPAGVALARGFGQADARPVEAHTPFWIGSVTKTLTAAAAAQLASTGTLDLDAPISEVIPGLAWHTSRSGGAITTRHLLHHRAGLRQWSGHDRRVQRTGRVDHLVPRRAPGGDAEYSSLNFILAGRAIEAASGMPYAEALRTYVLQPLGMDDAFVMGGAGERTAALGHQSYFGLQRRRVEPIAPPYLVPAGFVAASADDLARFASALLAEGVTDGRTWLDREATRAMLSPMDSVGPAMAWGRSRRDGTVLLEHAGSARTSSARLRLVPAGGYAITVLANTNSGPFFPATEDLVEGIATILEGGVPDDPFPAERLFRAALALGTVLSVAQLANRARSWDRAGRPTRIDASGRVLAPLAVEVAGGTFLLLGLPRVIGVPLGTMHEYFPDLGLAITVSAVSGLAGGMLRAWTRSAP